MQHCRRVVCGAAYGRIISVKDGELESCRSTSGGGGTCVRVCVHVRNVVVRARVSSIAPTCWPRTLLPRQRITGAAYV